MIFQWRDFGAVNDGGLVVELRLEFLLQWDAIFNNFILLDWIGRPRDSDSDSVKMASLEQNRNAIHILHPPHHNKTNNVRIKASKDSVKAN